MKSRLQYLTQRILDGVPLPEASSKLLSRGEPIPIPELLNLWNKDPFVVMCAAFHSPAHATLMDFPVAEGHLEIYSVRHQTIFGITEERKNNTEVTLHQADLLNMKAFLFMINAHGKAIQKARSYCQFDEDALTIERFKKKTADYFFHEESSQEDPRAWIESVTRCCEAFSQSIGLLVAFESTKAGKVPDDVLPSSAISFDQSVLIGLLNEISASIQDSSIAEDVALWLAKSRGQAQLQPYDEFHEYRSIRDLIITNNLSDKCLTENFELIQPNRLLNTLSIGAMVSNDPHKVEELRSAVERIKPMAKTSMDLIIAQTKVSREGVMQQLKANATMLFTIGLMHKASLPEILKSLVDCLSIIPQELRITNTIDDSTGLLSIIEVEEPVAIVLLADHLKSNPGEVRGYRSMVKSGNLSDWQKTVIANSLPSPVKIVSNDIAPSP